MGAKPHGGSPIPLTGLIGGYPVRVAGTHAHEQVQLLLMSEPMGFWPAGFPPELAEAAFWSNEPAWEPRIAAQVVEWLGSHQYAVLGTELWVIRGGLINTLPTGRSGMPEVHGNTVSRRASQQWAAFASRAASETVAYLRLFQSGEIAEPGEVRFNVTWVSQNEFEKLLSM